MKKQSQNKPNSKTEDRKQNTEDSKIMAKDKPNVFYNCREPSTNQAYFMQNKANLKNRSQKTENRRQKAEVGRQPTRPTPMPARITALGTGITVKIFNFTKVQL